MNEELLKFLISKKDLKRIKFMGSSFNRYEDFEVKTEHISMTSAVADRDIVEWLYNYGLTQHPSLDDLVQTFYPLPILSYYNNGDNYYSYVLLRLKDCIYWTIAESFEEITRDLAEFSGLQSATSQRTLFIIDPESDIMNSFKISIDTNMKVPELLFYFGKIKDKLIEFSKSTKANKNYPKAMATAMLYFGTLSLIQELFQEDDPRA